MNDLLEPRRLMDARSGASSELAAILASAAADDNPRKMRHLADRLAPLLFVAPAVAVGATAASASAAPGAVAATAKASVLVKIAFGLSASIVVAGASVAGWHAVRQQTPGVSRSTPPPYVEQAVAVAPNQMETETPPVEEPIAVPETSERTRRPSGEALPAEAQMLSRAQVLVRSNPTAALAVIRSHAARFPASRMEQEREVLMIEALARLGRNDAARARVERFHGRFPSSAYASRLRQLVADPP